MDKYILGTLLFLIIITLIFIDEDKKKIITITLTKRYELGFLFLTLLFYTYIRNNKKCKKLVKIADRSLFALIIALSAHLRLYVLPFWFVFFILYFNIINLD